MRIGLKYSWWVHIPAMVIVGVMIGVAAMRWPWPVRAPVHFNLQWQVDRWGSPWEAMVFPPLAAIMAASGLFLSAAWSREERGRKRFNVVLPLIAAPLGGLAGVHLWYWGNLSALAQTGHAPGPWWWVGIGVGINLAATLILESFRKSAPPDQDEASPASKSPDEIAAENELKMRMEGGGRWTYFATQRSLWMAWLIGGMGVIMIASAGFDMTRSRALHWPGTILIVTGILLGALSFLISSLSVQVSATRLVLRGGLLRARLLRLELSDIVDVRVETFSPLKDFGGWGIRRAGNTCAYIFGGNRGVRLQTRAGRGYVIGSPEPEKLAAVIRAGAGERAVSS